MRECAERKSAESGKRDVLRVQDSIFSSLPMKTFETVSNVARDLSRKVREDGAGAVGMSSELWINAGVMFTLQQRRFVSLVTRAIFVTVGLGFASTFQTFWFVVLSKTALGPLFRCI